MNGLSGALILGGLGIARTMDLNCGYKADIIPVDLVVNSLLVLGAHTALFPSREPPHRVVHITSGQQNPITWGQILDYARMSALEKPSMKVVRPIAKNPVVARNRLGRLRHQLVKIFSHYLFALLLDLVLLLTGHRRFMMSVTRRMHRAFDVLEHFTSREWSFRYRNYLEIYHRVVADEQPLFRSNVAEVDWVRYCDSINMGTRRYLLKEDDSSIDNARRRLKILNLVYGLVDLIGLLAAGCALFYLLWSIYLLHLF